MLNGVNYRTLARFVSVCEKNRTAENISIGYAKPDSSIRTVAQPHRLTPFHGRNKVEYKLIELENDDVITKV